MSITHPTATIGPARIRPMPLLGHWLAGWAVCTSIMAVGPLAMTMDATLVVHAAAAPAVFGGLSWRYFMRYGDTTPLQTAALFAALVAIVDFVLVAVIIMRSLEMFASPLGTWIPFSLIFASTFTAGVAAQRMKKCLTIGG
ncbi:MAG: hypothetical protein ACE5GC_07350 [Acidimicrobiia bacterium]